MGLFSNRKKDEKKNDGDEQQSPPSQENSAPDPSVQRKGPTPPGGLLPKPGWEQEKSTPINRDKDIPATTPLSKGPVSPGLEAKKQRKEKGASDRQQLGKPIRKESAPNSNPEADLPPTVQSHPSERPTVEIDSRATGHTKPITQHTSSTGLDGKKNVKAAPAVGENASFSKIEARGTALEKLLLEAVDQGASDLHISRGVPPTIRLDGYLVPLDFPKLSKADCHNLIYSALNDLQRAKFEKDLELDFSVDLPDAGRFRVNIHKQRGVTEGAFRVVNDVILPLRRLGLPGVVEEIGRKHTGLILVTGPTGSGKTTTLASIIDQINSERQCMIVTVEDPIEYVHKNKRCIIKQREVMSDTHSFPLALRHVLRQDPDVIVIGEMRDLETISTALTAAETGHLVFATLHTPDASQTVDRIIDVFPPHQQEQTRIQLANTLEAIVAQQLIPVPGNRGRVVGVEILMATVAVKKIIRSGKTEQLYTSMQTNWEAGMITMDKSLKTLYQQGLISFDDALARAKYPHDFDNI